MLNYDIVIIGVDQQVYCCYRRMKVWIYLIIERDKELGGIFQQCIHNGFGLHFFKEELTDLNMQNVLFKNRKV